MTALSDTVEADQALKAKHRAMWALGDYPSVAAEIIPDLGAVLVEACGVGPGARVLDVAAGSGNATIPAALTGASVVACDLTPELFASGRDKAVQHGVEVEWHEADAEALPFADGEFDVVLSCVGVMFAPHHQATADELTRVCRPGGTIGLLSWTPEGFLGQMLATMKPYAPRLLRVLSRLRCGATRTMCARCSATESLTLRPAATTSESIASRTPRHSASTSRPTMARRSSPTGASPRTPIGLMRWTATSPTSPDASTMAPTRRSWTGSTYYSPPATAAEGEHRRPGLRTSNMALRCWVPNTNDNGL